MFVFANIADVLFNSAGCISLGGGKKLDLIRGDCQPSSVRPAIPVNVNREPGLVGRSTPAWQVLSTESTQHLLPSRDYRQLGKPGLG